MKRGLLIGLLLGIFLINFASAQFLNIGYGNYFDDSMIVYGLIFVIFFAFISFALGRTVFKENKGTNAVASLAIAGLAVWGLTKTNINVGGFHVGNLYIGDYAPTIFTILLIGLLIYSIYRRVFANVLIGLGLFLIIISFTGLVYEKNIILILGIILLIIGLLLRFRFTGRWNIGGAGGGGRAPPGRVTLIIRVQGNGRTNPSQGIHTPRENRNIRINATPAPGNAFRYWIVNGNQFTRRSMRLRMDRNYDCTAVFSDGGGGAGHPGNRARTRGIYILKQQYCAYIQQKNRIQITNRHTTGNQRATAIHQLRRIRQAMETIINMANRQGVSEREFLSSRYGTRERAPGQLSWRI